MDDTDDGNHDNVSIPTERQIMEEILELYKDLPCLWEVSNQLYSNEQARNQSLEILLTKWIVIDNSITLEGVINKLENMRSSFDEEMKKVEESKATGAAAADVYKPELWYYEHFMFIFESQTQDGIDSTETEDSNNPSNNETNVEEINEDSDKKSNPIETTQSKGESSKNIKISQEAGTSTQRPRRQSLKRPTSTSLKWLSKNKKEISNIKRALMLQELRDSILFQRKMHKLNLEHLKQRHELKILKLKMEIDNLKD